MDLEDNIIKYGTINVVICRSILRACAGAQIIVVNC